MFRLEDLTPDMRASFWRCQYNMETIAKNNLVLRGNGVDQDNWRRIHKYDDVNLLINDKSAYMVF